MGTEQQASLGVLIVDDHDAYRTVASDVVEAAKGFVVIASAGSRHEALQCLRRHGAEIDLVLMDVNLGVDDGVSLTSEISERTPHPDILLVTALAFDDLPRSARTCGARGYLPKAQLSPSALSQVRTGVYDWSDGNNTGRTGR